MTSSAELIFLSHSSQDKDFVDALRRRLPQSHLFYDVVTIDPATSTLDAMKEGIARAAVFVYFVSPNMPESVWTKYEASLAELEKIRRPAIPILVVPIKGASYRDAPDWMHQYMAFPVECRISDITRRILYVLEEMLRVTQKILPKLFVGREDLKQTIAVDTLNRQMKEGIPLNFLVLAGIDSMGRQTLARIIHEAGSIIPR